MVHVVHPVVGHYAQFGGYGLLAQVTLVRAVVVLYVLLQARAVLKYPLASSATSQQGARVLTVVLTALHVTT